MLAEMTQLLSMEELGTVEARMPAHHGHNHVPNGHKGRSESMLRRATARSKGRLSWRRHLLPAGCRRSRRISRAIQEPPNILGQSPSSSRSLAGISFDKALESADNVAMPDPRQWSACHRGHCFVREGRYTQAAELLQAAFTFVNLALKIGFSNELGIIRRGTGRRICALSDPFPRSHIKDKSGHTLKHCQQQ